jgi:hypothetical protein
MSFEDIKMIEEIKRIENKAIDNKKNKLNKKIRDETTKYKKYIERLEKEEGKISPKIETLKKEGGRCVICLCDFKDYKKNDNIKIFDCCGSSSNIIYMCYECHKQYNNKSCPMCRATTTGEQILGAKTDQEENKKFYNALMLNRAGDYGAIIGDLENKMDNCEIGHIPEIAKKINKLLCNVNGEVKDNQKNFINKFLDDLSKGDKKKRFKLIKKYILNQIDFKDKKNNDTFILNSTIARAKMRFLGNHTTNKYINIEVLKPVKLDNTAYHRKIYESLIHNLRFIHHTNNTYKQKFIKSLLIYAHTTQSADYDKIIDFILQITRDIDEFNEDPTRNAIITAYDILNQKTKKYIIDYFYKADEIVEPPIMGRYCGYDVYIKTGKYYDSETDTDSDTETETDSDTETETDSDTETETDSDTETDTDSD